MKVNSKKIFKKNLNNNDAILINYKKKLKKIPDGMLLFCGETNNGMTTTLSTLLNNKC